MAVDLKKEFTFKDILEIFKKKGPKLRSAEENGNYEINLVPDIKGEMIRKLKLRNFIFFVCLVASGAAVGVVAVLGSAVGTQGIVIAQQDNRLNLMSEKIKGYEGLAEFMTVQDQLGKIQKIGDNKKMLSRVFNVLGVLLPNNGDSITLSELNVSLQNNTLNFDAQADAGDPTQQDIDYRVLEAFEKSVVLSKYDYGRYVDAEGNEIQARCMEEQDANGNVYSDNGSIYAIWHRSEKGCDPARDDSRESDVELEFSEESQTGGTQITEIDTAIDTSNQVVVPDERVYRTPQFTKWYNAGNATGSNQVVDTVLYVPAGTDREKIVVPEYRPSMSTDGEIEGVPHFNSLCITYSGAVEKDKNGKDTVKWTADNDCLLAAEAPSITNSSNGRDADEKLVLRFEATVTLNPEVFSFQYKHMMAIGPANQNVTDSYVQIQDMFAERARDCSDEECRNNTRNSGGV